MVASAIMAGVGAAASLGGVIASAIGSKRKNDEANRLLADQRRENRAWYNRRMSEDYTMRSDAQAVIKRQRELLREMYDRARATNVVAGGTDESLALQKQAANRSLSDTMTNIASNASNYKDNVENAYRQADFGLNQQQQNVARQQANAIAQAGGQVASAGLNLMGNSLHEMGQLKVNKLNQEESA